MYLTSSRLAFLGVMIGCFVGSTGWANVRVSPSESLRDPPATADLSKGVVTILVYGSSGDEPSFQGTGWILDPKTVVTCGHLFWDIDNARAEIVTAGGERAWVAGVTGTDPARDTLLLHVLALPKSGQPLKTAVATPAVGDAVSVIGSPEGVVQSTTTGQILRVLDLGEMGIAIHSTAHVAPGSSGSPMLNARGEVVAMVLRLVSGKHEVAIATSMTNLARIARHESVPLATWRLGREVVPTRPDPFFRGIELVLDQDVEGAIAQFMTLWNPQKPDGEIAALLGYCNAEQGKWAAARDWFVRSLRVRPNHLETLHNLGVAYGEAGDSVNEIATYQAAISVDPLVAREHYNLAVAYQRVREWQQSYDSAIKAIALGDTHAEPHYAAGIALIRLKRAPEAVVSIQSAITCRPDWAVAHHGLGLAYIIVGKRELAEEQAKVLDELDPDLAKNLRATISSR